MQKYASLLIVLTNTNVHSQDLYDRCSFFGGCPEYKWCPQNTSDVRFQTLSWPILVSLPDWLSGIQAVSLHRWCPDNDCAEGQVGRWGGGEVGRLKPKTHYAAETQTPAGTG